MQLRPAPESHREGKVRRAAATSVPGARPAAGASDGGGEEGERGGLEGGEIGARPAEIGRAHV